MIKFKRLPDKVFNEILKNTFESAISNLILNREEYLNDLFLYSNKFFTLESAIITLEQMKVYQEFRGVYRLSKYHVALIQDALHDYRMMLEMEADTSDGTPIVQGTKIQKIDFDNLFEIYFTRYELVRVWRENNNIGHKVSRNLGKPIKKPTYDDLKFVDLNDDAYIESKEEPLYSSESIVYPDIGIFGKREG
jgi:hypothetical protein